MIELIVINRRGEEETVAAENGVNLMEALRDAGYDELSAMCGGNCACATCHVYVQPALGALSPKSDMENELLETSLYVREDSRLGCQVAVDSALAGARVIIAPED